MTIHQMHIGYDEAEDRLLLRLSTTDACEFRFWLTRRYTKRLWTMLAQMLEWDRAVKQQIDPEMRRSVLDLQHESYARDADYTTPFRQPADDAPPRMPLGDAPVLLTTAQASKREDGLGMLRLHPSHGQGIDITVDARLLHLFMRLLREQVAKTDWDVNLALYEPAALQEKQPRMLN